MAEVGLRLHPDKTRIVYCKDSNRRGKFDNISFTFPGVHISPPARAEQAEGREFHIVPARDEPGEAGRERTGGPSLAAAPAAKRHSGDLAEAVNAIVRGWMTYWGRFYRTEMIPLLRRINTYLMRWARKKYKRLCGFKRLKAWWIRKPPACI